MIIHAIRSWGPVTLVAFEAEAGDPCSERAAIAFVFETEHPPDVWNVDATLMNWRCRMNARYVRASKSAMATLAHTDTLHEWIAYTRSLANDLRTIYGDRLAGVLEHVATETQQAVTWLETRIESPPRDQGELADLFLTVDLWAYDRVVRDTLVPLCRGNTEGIPGKDAGRTILLTPAINALRDAGLKHMQSDEGWKMRVRRLRVRAGEEDNLVADVLDACRRGPYDKNGRAIDHA